MRGVKLHALILALVLMVAGFGATAYQIMVLNIPMSESETDPVWVIDARLSFRASGNTPVKAQLFVPPPSDRYLVLNESFISQNYGFNVSRVDANRAASRVNPESFRDSGWPACQAANRAASRLNPESFRFSRT